MRDERERISESGCVVLYAGLIETSMQGKQKFMEIKKKVESAESFDMFDGNGKMSEN